MRAGSRRAVRSAATLIFTGLCIAYVVWKIDVRQTAHLLAHAKLGYFAASAAITLVAVLPMAWRWQRLLEARGVHAPLDWLTRTYYVSYAVAQVLPTSLGGDAARIYSTTRRYPRAGAAAAGSVILERVLGGAATLTLAGIGFVLAIGKYDVGPYLWLEGGLAVATVAGIFVLFSRRFRRLLAPWVPIVRRLRLERPLRAAYEGIHAYRGHPALLGGAFGLTIAIAAARVAGIWLIGKACGVDLSPRPYYVLGPLLFLVMLVPFTVNGVALREAFFVSFLGKLHVGADAAFATGFLFFLMAVATALPGAIIIAVEAIPSRARTSPKGSEPDSEWSRASRSLSSSLRTTRRSSSRRP